MQFHRGGAESAEVGAWEMSGRIDLTAPRAGGDFFGFAFCGQGWRLGIGGIGGSKMAMDGPVDLSEQIIGAAIEVHRALGPGLLESAYLRCLQVELELRGLNAEAEVPVPLIYKGLMVDAGYRLDLLVAQQVIVEVKSVVRLEPIHTAQALTYLRLTGKQVGLLINFNAIVLKDGLRRVVLGA